MPLFITSLNSGSNGNCYYIGNQQEAILVDAGISCRETERRMKRLGLQMDLLKAIFVSHEHGDHITGVAGLSKKYQLPVYITEDTYRESRIPIDDRLRFPFASGDSIPVGDLQVHAFSKYHDACDPHSFVVSGGGVQVGVFTDIGVCCAELRKQFAGCHAAFLEANYCENMLQNGSYPFHLKKRISGGKGHLSNRQALELYTRFAGPGLRHLVLSHLSKNNNRPELVETLFRTPGGATQITVASRYQEMPLLTVTATTQLTIF